MFVCVWVIGEEAQFNIILDRDSKVEVSFYHKVCSFSSHKNFIDLE